jgi:hypothetical protein
LTTHGTPPRIATDTGIHHQTVRKIIADTSSRCESSDRSRASRAFIKHRRVVVGIL